MAVFVGDDGVVVANDFFEFTLYFSGFSEAEADVGQRVDGAGSCPGVDGGGGGRVLVVVECQHVLPLIGGGCFSADDGAVWCEVCTQLRAVGLAAYDDAHRGRCRSLTGVCRYVDVLARCSGMNVYSLMELVQRPRRVVVDALRDRWYAAAQARAGRDELWASIQARRHDPEQPGVVRFLDDDLSWDDWQVQSEIFDRLNPVPWWRHVDWWLDQHGPAAVACRAYEFVQRGRRGFSDRDVWGFCDYLDALVADAAEQLRVTTHGYPPDLTAGQWDDVLARISYGLRVDPDAPPGSAQANARVVARALVAQHWDSLWD